MLCLNRRGCASPRAMNSSLATASHASDPYSGAIVSRTSQVQDLAGPRLFQWAEGRVQLRQRADPGTWAQRRARFKPHWDRPGTGGATGSRAALAEASSWVFCCQRCGGITDFKAACRQARAAGRQQAAPGDGCGSIACFPDHRPARFARHQHERAHTLTRGETVLIVMLESLRRQSYVQCRVCV